jgi:CubicO group peptidase (beta-lactamase class C family)
VQPLEESLTRAADASPGASGVVRVGYEPGSDWRYAGGGYALLQLIVEEATGGPFDSFMQRMVFGPLGLSRSAYEWRPDGGSTLATFYDVDSRPATHHRLSAAGAASLYTSVSDLTRFIQAHLPGRNGEPVGRGVLEPATVAEMRRPHASKYGQAIWGLGTMLYAGDGEGDFVIGHDGNNAPAINTAARFNPSTGNGIVVLETGNPLLATTLAGEWVFWRRGTSTS